MKIFNFCLIALFVLVLFFAPLYAQEEADTGQTEEVDVEQIAESYTEQPEKTELSKQEIIERLTEIFKNREDIREEIEGISEADRGFGVYYEFNGVKLESLNRDILQGILNAVNQKITQKNMENMQRIQKQMRDMQTIQSLQRTQGLLRQQPPKAPTPPPKVQTPPRIPQPPRR